MKVKHTIRTYDGMREVNLSPIKAIKEHCSECMCWVRAEVLGCTDKLCPLYPFRLGKNPGLKRELTEEQKEALSDRAKKLFGYKL